MNSNPTTTIEQDFLAENHRVATIFRRFGPDCCYGGGIPVEQACGKVGEMPGEYPTQHEKVLALSVLDGLHVKTYDADFLTDYIMQNHHRYIRSVSPSILRYGLKVARNHGGSRPDLIEIGKTFTQLTSHLEAHMMKEEQVLFPYIKALIQAHRQKGPLPVAPFSTMSRLVQTAMMEHEQAERWMTAIRELSNDYTPPSDACMSCRILYRELEDFERDLHRLMHMEDFVLFPKALALEAQSGQNV